MSQLNTNALITIDAVSHCYRGSTQPALQNLTTQIFAGKITGLVGPDGAGKSTLMRLMCGLLLPSSGSIAVNSLSTVRDAEAIRSFTGYMPQKFGLYEDLTVIENLRLYAALRDLNADIRDEQFKKLLNFTNLESFQNRITGKLSGGMKQKLGLACATMGRPKLLLLDEPSVGVDPISRRELWQMVQHLLREGLCVVWSTSYLDEAEQCNSVILLNEGAMKYAGAPSDFLDRVHERSFLLTGVEPKRRRFVLMQLLNSSQVLDAVIQGKTLRLVLQSSEVKPNLSSMVTTDIVRWQAVASRFEDAFVDSLGGVQDGRSLLAEHITQKPEQTEPVIVAQKLTKKFGDFTAVSNNDFSIYRGEIFGLLGPNGAGKSTTFKMMCGLLQPTSGRATVMGLDLKTASSQARNRIGYMAQKFSLYESLNIIQNLRFFSGLYGLSGQTQKQQIDSMIEIFDFEKHLKQKAVDLSLGYKQRLALACAVMHEPDVLFLDEPTSGVDPLTRREFWTHINGMVEKGVTVMVTTHFMDEAEYCDRIALIYRSRNIASGTPDELKDLVKHDIGENPTLEDAFIQLIKRDDTE